MTKKFRHSEAWDAWIIEMTKLAKKHGLPSRVESSQSPFVEFIWELQESLPTEYRQPFASKDALATAIITAREQHDEK